MEDKQDNKRLEKFGTSQFGAEQKDHNMLHSWANVSNPNPFFGHVESVLNPSF